MTREELIAYDKWLTRRKWGTGEIISPEKAADLYLAEHPLPPAEGAEEYLRKHPFLLGETEDGEDYLSTEDIELIKQLAPMLEEFATLHAQRLAEKMVEEKLRAMIERCKKLEFMIENGLGWKDMENDITMPHEL